MNYIKPEDIKEYVSKSPTGVAGMSKELAEMVNYFTAKAVKECIDVLDPNGEYSEKYKYSHTPGPDGLRTVLSHEHFYEMMAANKLKKHFKIEE